MSSLLETFRDEALELLQELEEALLELEEKPNDPTLVDRVFRALHTLKGSGGLAGFDHVAGFCHEAETVFEMIRAGERQVDQALVSLTLRAQDHLKGMILHEFGDDAVDDEITADLIAAFQELLASMMTVLPTESVFFPIPVCSNKVSSHSSCLKNSPASVILWSSLKLTKSPH